MKKVLYLGLVLSCSAVLFTGCKSVEKILNKQLSKLSTVDQQVNAVEQSLLSVDSIEPSAGVFISSGMIKEFLSGEVEKMAMNSVDPAYNVLEINSDVALGKQSIIVNAQFTMYVRDVDANITGTMKGLAGVSSLRDTVFFFGAFSSMEIESINFLSKKPGITKRAKAKLIKPILKNYLNNVNRLMFKNPATIFSGVGSNLDINIKDMFNDPRTSVLSSPTNSIQRTVKRTSFLIDEDGLKIMLELSSEDGVSDQTKPIETGRDSHSRRELNKKFDIYHSKYSLTWLSTFESVPDSANLATYISKAEIASLFNEAMAGEISISQHVVIPESSSTSEIGLDESDIDCDYLRKPFSYPEFNARNCDWNCTRVISTFPVRITGDDPFCLTSRATCVAQRELERSTWRAGREASRIARQLDNEKQVLACNVLREANDFMNLGKTKTQILADGTITLKLSNIVFNNDLTLLTLNNSGSLGVNFDTKISLQPQDLGYVFLCISGYTKRINGKAVASFSNQDMAIDFNVLHKVDKLLLTATPSSIDYKAKVNPIPSTELLSDIEFGVKCSFLYSVLSIATVTSFTDIVKYDEKTELFLQGQASGSYEIPPFTQTINPILFRVNKGEARKAIPVWGQHCISFVY